MDERKTQEMEKHKELEVHLTVEYVPMPPEHEEAWKAGVRLLLDLLTEEWRRK